jgi:class 3 adenylate cyclase
MLVCGNCGERNVDRARFCSNCAQPLETSEASPYVRKTVTVLFCDVTGSTSLGEQLDPESMRRVMLRYFDEMRTVLERHGGTVEKFIGDAVMAVFGVPVVHEDDALRAVRAAEEMRAALRRLNDELERSWGVRLEERIGINTGEVVAGNIGSQTRMDYTVIGDNVNVASRIESTGRAGEVHVSEAVYEAVKDRVEATSLGPISVKNRVQPVEVYVIWDLRE